MRGKGDGLKVHVELTGNELGEHGSTSELRKAAARYAESHFFEKDKDGNRKLMPPVANVHSKHRIAITWQGVKHSLAGANVMEVKLLAGLPRMLSCAEYQGASPDRLDRPHIMAVHKYMAVAKVGGETLHVGWSRTRNMTVTSTMTTSS